MSRSRRQSSLLVAKPLPPRLLPKPIGMNWPLIWGSKHLPLPPLPRKLHVRLDPHPSRPPPPPRSQLAPLVPNPRRRLLNRPPIRSLPGSMMSLLRLRQPPRRPSSPVKILLNYRRLPTSRSKSWRREWRLKSKVIWRRLRRYSSHPMKWMNGKLLSVDSVDGAAVAAAGGVKPRRIARVISRRSSRLKNARELVRSEPRRIVKGRRRADGDAGDEVVRTTLASPGAIRPIVPHPKTTPMSLNSTKAPRENTATSRLGKR